jgi:transposase
MPKKIDYTLTTEMLILIEQTIKNYDDLRVRKRATIIRLLHLGHKPQEIASLLSTQPGQVYYWHKRWREEGLEGLSDKPRSGRPPATDEQYRQLLEQTIAQNPQTLGYAFTVWDGKRLIAHLEKETGLKVTERTLYNILEQEGYVYRRPKHTLDPLQDKEVKERAEATLKELKKKLKKAPLNYSLWTKQP